MRVGTLAESEGMGWQSCHCAVTLPRGPVYW